MSILKHGTIIFSLITISLISGCSSPPLKKAIHLSPEYQTTSFGEITLLPVIDSRLDKEVEVNLEEQLRNPIKEMLKSKGYVVNTNNNVDSVAGITEDNLKSIGPMIIKRLDFSTTRQVMIILLVDVNTKLTFGSTGTAEVSGFMFDKETEKMIWRDKGIGKSGQGGLIGMMMKGMMDEAAISMAAMNLMASVPEHLKSDRVQ